MQGRGLSTDRYRFGAFVLDVRTGELRKGPTRLRVPDQSIEVLKALLERPGELVTREELRQRLWANDTFVDFEQGLNGIVRRLRDAIGDSAEAPVFIETLPRRGYRFIGVLEAAEAPAFPAAPPLGAETPRRVNVRQVASLIVVAAATIALLGLLTASWLRHAARSAAVNAIPVTSYPGLEEEPSVSPDGQQVAFAWRGEDADDYNIFVKFIDRDEYLQLTSDPAIESRPAWSPDGERIAFLRQRPNGAGSTIVVVPALGGTEQPVIDTTVVPDTPFENGLSWTPDGKGLLFLDAAQSPSSVAIFLCWIDSRERHQLTTPTADFSDASPTIAPDGRRMAFVRRFSGFTNGRVFVQSLDAMRPVGEPRALTFDDRAMGVDWTADSRSVVFGTSDGLWRIRADGGSPEMVYPGRWYLSPSVARYGRRLMFQHLTTDPNIWRVGGTESAVSASPEPTKVIASTYADTSPNISWDGRRIAYRSNRSGVTEIWVSNIDGSESIQVTHAGGRFVGSPRWSPDGESVAFDSMQSGTFTIFVVSAHGGDMHAVTHVGNSYRPSWSPDGRWIYFGSTQSEIGQQSGVEQIWKIRSDGSGKAVQLTKNGGREGFASFDRKYVYYAKPRITPGIWRVPVDGGAEVKVLDRVIESSWGLTRQGIVFMDKLAWPQASIEFYGYDGTLRTRMLLPARLRFDPGNPTFSVAPDESWIVFTQLDSWGSDIEMIDHFR